MGSIQLSLRTSCGISGGGRSCQRSQKRYSAKNGTNQPKLYCSLTNHSPLSSLQSTNQSAAKSKTLSAIRAGKCLVKAGDVSAPCFGVARFCTDQKLTKFMRKANGECFWGEFPKCVDKSRQTY